MRILILVLLGLFWQPALAADAGSAAERLYRLLKPIQSLSGRFDQMVVDDSGSRLQQSRGQFWIQRPDRLRWVTAGPFAQLLVADGRYLWIHDEDLQQVTRRDLGAHWEGTPALLLGGDLDRLDATFRVHERGSGLSEPSSGSGEHSLFELVPRSEEAIFDRMMLRFVEGRPREIQLLDDLGQRTSVLLQDLELNPDLKAERFEFEPPPGTDVIRQ